MRIKKRPGRRVAVGAPYQIVLLGGRRRSGGFLVRRLLVLLGGGRGLRHIRGRRGGGCGGGRAGCRRIGSHCGGGEAKGQKRRGNQGSGLIHEFSKRWYDRHVKEYASIHAFRPR